MSPQYLKGGETCKTTGDPIVERAASTPRSPLSRKRPADGPQGSDRKSQKLRHKSTPGGGSAQIRPWTGVTDDQKKAYLQVGRYLLEKFSTLAFRSHATVGLVDRDRIQFYHANRSVILVTSAITFSPRDRTGGVDKFIAIVIAFSRLTLRDNGILHNLHDGKLFGGNEALTKSPAPGLTHGTVRIQAGRKLEFGGNEKTGPFTLTYGDVISNEPSLTGRSTVVLHAKSPAWKDVDLVVKIGWPSSQRDSEQQFLNKATETAESASEHNWALDHLPRVFFAQDVTLASDSTYEMVANLFDDAEFVNGEYKYERRTMRIIIQERLYPLKSLANKRDIAQVLVDIACSTCLLLTSWSPYAYASPVHRWLYDHGILHQDLSPNNTMYRMIMGTVHGVLTDFDLASWVSPLAPDCTKPSQQPTGTPPFMAHGLLYGTDHVHMYRHDIESFFYIMLIMATHYEIQAPKGRENGGVRIRDEDLPFQCWFGAFNYSTLGSSKLCFFAMLKKFEVSPSFKGFDGWLRKLQRAIRRGLLAKMDQFLEVEDSCDKDTRPPFDEETLGGHITYSALIQPVRDLTGELAGLAIRYDPTSSISDSITGVEPHV